MALRANRKSGSSFSDSDHLKNAKGAVADRALFSIWKDFLARSVHAFWNFHHKAILPLALVHGIG